MNAMTMAAAVSQVYRSSAGLADQDIAWQPSTITVMKQEPMDVEQLSASPINDSGISPDHISCGGSSAGRPSPQQQSGCEPRSSPDQQHGSPVGNPLWGVREHSPQSVPPKIPSPSSVTLTSPGKNQLAMALSTPTGLSDDNSLSSSSMDAESLYSKSGLEQSPLRCLQMTVEKTTMVIPQKSEGNGGGGPRHPFQCPLCEYSTISRLEFNDHLRAHYPDLKCDRCEFTTKLEDELLAHTRERHLSSPVEGGQIGEDGQGDPNSPHITTQEKVKKYRCKQCSFVAVIKVEYWLHLRTHMRPDKILNCPRCLFATELKHHLEYHLRNHEQRKPYRCTECEYRCVNKSMLNSHLKSHSSVYQYRCASCSYATKYCHSLKLHLRKYDHTPDMVLNPDGTPNPHPIIDVYGTRRGPKQRPKLPTQKQEMPVVTSAPMITGPPHVPGIQLGMLQASYGLISHTHRDLPLPYPFGSLIGNAFTPNNNNNNNNNSIIMEYNHNIQEKPNGMTELKSTTPEEIFHTLLPTPSQNVMNNHNPLPDPKKDQVNFAQERQTDSTEYTNALETSAEKILTGTPLDLSKPEAMVFSPEPVTAPVSQSPQVSASKSSTKNRRKGQAFKLDNISRKLQQQCLTDQESVSRCLSDDKPKSPVQIEEPETMELKRNSDDTNKQVVAQGSPEKISASVQNIPEVFHCSYCAITFGDPIMYTIHKGYHGFQDPFTCNMCGIQTSNRVEFFLHVARHPHC